jgi:hypothetical protein
MSWLDDLDAELRAAGIPRKRRQRIAAELDDHLRCDPDAQLGEPRDLARRFADELGTAYARRAGFGVFLALAPVGLLFGALLLVSGFAVVNGGVVLGTQLAFVGGMLALLRAWRLRGASVVSTGDAVVLRRRAGLGIAGGALTLASIAGGPGSLLSWTTVAVGALLLGTSALPLARAVRVRPTVDGPRHDLSFDLPVGMAPWPLAFAIAGVVALCIVVDGVVASDPYDGLARAVADGALCLAGFAVLGGYLGLRRR